MLLITPPTVTPSLRGTKALVKAKPSVIHTLSYIHTYVVVCTDKGIIVCFFFWGGGGKGRVETFGGKLPLLNFLDKIQSLCSSIPACASVKPPKLTRAIKQYAIKLVFCFQLIDSGYGYSGSLDYLLECGGNLNLANNFGHTPLHIAARHGDAVTTSYLIFKGANIHSMDQVRHNKHATFHTDCTVHRLAGHPCIWLHKMVTRK